MAITGVAMLLFGVLLLWARVMVFLEATPWGFTHRGVLGRSTTIGYEELAAIRTVTRHGATQVTVVAADGRRFSAPLYLMDRTYLDRWRAWRTEQGRPVDDLES